ncbi:amino acid permease [Streptomyces sp. JV176]|uniref:amino acid permease n=1 Tax=Streptomyces sp. JV176 TaxID=858630 RepID=UPI002E763DDA|nr:amino acid permease [Streptomyces sp. JV176]MEE1804747.1 amino acid permease [Streptomyces sp. JV176]
MSQSSTPAENAAVSPLAPGTPTRTDGNGAASVASAAPAATPATSTTPATGTGTADPATAAAVAAASAADGHATGYKPQFARTLSRFESFAVAFSFISITTGLFTTYGTVLGSAGPAGIWTWPLVTLGTVLVALVYGMLASRIPISGYSYQWASRLASPVLGWWFGWVSFAFLAIVVVAVDYGLTQVALFPLLDITYTATGGAIGTVIVLLLQMSLIIWSTPITTKVNNLAVGAEVIAMVGLTVLIAGAVLFFGKGDWSNLGSYGTIPADGYYGFLGPFMLSALLGAFTLVGWESAANLAEETHNPKKVVPQAMVRAILLSGGIGMLFLIVITAGVGDDVAALTADSAPVASIIESTVGSAVATAMLVVVCIAIFACGLVIMVSNSRLVHSMARDGRLPFSETLSQVPRPTGGPTWATLTVALASIAIVAVFSGNADALPQLLGAGTLMPAILYAGTVTLFIFTRRKYTPGPDDFQLGKWEKPVVAGAVLWLVLELCIFMIPSDFRGAQQYALATLVVGGLLFASVWFTRREKLVQQPSLDGEGLIGDELPAEGDAKRATEADSL